FVCRLLHLKIISLKKPLQIGLCNKADESYKSCTTGARYFKKVDWFNMENFKKIIEHYGSPLYSNPFGHSDCELLIGFSHNTPNNTLPVFWKDGYIPETNNSWFPIFKRFEKNYGSVRS
ncbi:phosphoribosyltransferase-like protein, partial [Acinetobacter baumannii]